MQQRLRVVLIEDDEGLNEAIVMLLEFSGYDVKAALKADPATRHLPVVILSASGDAKALSADAGANAFLPKPFTRVQLQSMLQRVPGP
jgi:CheY-like chemotaxis protein